MWSIECWCPQRKNNDGNKCAQFKDKWLHIQILYRKHTKWHLWVNYWGSDIFIFCMRASANGWFGPRISFPILSSSLWFARIVFNSMSFLQFRFGWRFGLHTAGRLCLFYSCWFSAHLHSIVLLFHLWLLLLSLNLLGSFYLFCHTDHVFLLARTHQSAFLRSFA